MVWFLLFGVCFLCPVLTFVFCCVAHFMACYGLSGARDGLENNVLKHNELLVHNWGLCVQQYIIISCLAAVEDHIICLVDGRGFREDSFPVVVG